MVCVGFGYCIVVVGNIDVDVVDVVGDVVGVVVDNVGVVCDIFEEDELFWF